MIYIIKEHVYMNLKSIHLFEKKDDILYEYGKNKIKQYFQICIKQFLISKVALYLKLK